MDFEILTLEVDGSLANPFAAGSVAVWTAILSGIAVLLVWRCGGSGWSWPAWVVFFAAAFLVTRPAQLVIGSALYWLIDHRITGVGFWGGPPVWIAPVGSSCVGLLAKAAVSYRRRRGRLSQPQR